MYTVSITLAVFSFCSWVEVCVFQNANLQMLGYLPLNVAASQKLVYREKGTVRPIVSAHPFLSRNALVKTLLSFIKTLLQQKFAPSGLQ